MTSHDAAPNAIGYVHQVDWALTEMLATGPDRPDEMMMLEQLDDVSWELDSGPTELLQVKHHIGKAGTLGDKSVDLWKSIKVWLDDGSFRDPSGPQLRLITTSGAPINSAASLLRSGEARDEDRALELLDEAARNSTSDTTKGGRHLWLKQPKDIRVGLVARLRVIDGSIKIEGVGDSIRRLLFWVGLDDQQLELFTLELRTWWHEVAIDLLLKRRPPVTAFEVRAKVERLRDAFTSRSLPTTVARPRADELKQIVGAHNDAVFVKQLDWIQVPTHLLERAVIDFWRTVEQTTVWVANHLIELAELGDYREALMEQWEYAWDAMLRKLPADAAPEVKADAGYALWSEMRDRTDPYLRAEYGEAFYRNGVLYELANTLDNTVAKGWHPEYEDMLRKLTVERAL